ncbi:MAG: DUF4292 domain-containing protein [Cytophagales bacterium]
MSRFPILILSFFLIWTFSCKRTKISTSSSTEIKTPIDSTVRKIPVEVNELEFNSFHGKGKLSYQDGSNSVNAHFNLRIRKDSVIWVSVSQFGIEGARFLITKDSIFGINRLNKEFYRYSISYFKEQFDVDIDFKTFQNILVGNIPLNVTDLDTLIEVKDHLVLKQKQKTSISETLIDKKNKRMEKFTVVQSPISNTLNTIYTDFQPLEKIMFAYKNSVSLKYLSDKGVVYNSVYIEFNKVDLNDKELKFPFNVPNRFNK